MRHVSATEAKQRFSALLDAAQREPVVIRKQKRDVAVLMSAADYERLCAHSIEEFQRYADRIGARAAERGLTPKKLDELLRDGDS